MFGKLIVDSKDNHKRVEKLLLWGSILAFSGLLLKYGCPINKKIWSPTFVLVTTGFAAQLLGLFIWIIDINKKQMESFFSSFWGESTNCIRICCNSGSIIFEHQIWMEWRNSFYKIVYL